MYSLKELEKEFLEIKDNCESALLSYKSKALSMSKETVVSKGALYNVRPYEIERAGFKPGRKLNKIPSNVKNTHIYHFDDTKKIIMVEIYGQSSNVINVEFYLYGVDYVKRIFFTSTGKLRNITVSSFNKDKRIEKDINWGEYGCSISDYQYEGETLKMITVQQKEHHDAEFSEYNVVFNYSNEKLLNIMHIFPNGYSEQRYP